MASYLDPRKKHFVAKPLAVRKAYAAKVLLKSNGEESYLPVLIIRGTDNCPVLPWSLTSVPSTYSFFHLKSAIESRVSKSSAVAFFYFIPSDDVVENSRRQLTNGDQMQHIYDTYKSDDDVLYIYMAGENVFG